MGTQHNFRKLHIWNRAMELTEHIYRLTGTFPDDERYGLTKQVQRAAVSIPSNIAEGSDRNTDKEFSYFLGIAAGSAAEVYTQLELAKRLGYLNESQTKKVLEDAITIKKMIYRFRRQLK